MTDGRGATPVLAVNCTADVLPDHREEIAEILSLWTGHFSGAQPLIVEPLPGGASNRNYTVTDAKTKYVLRVASDDPSGVNRYSSCEAQALAARAGIAPRLLASQLPQGHTLSEFLDGRVYSEDLIQEETAVRAAARGFRRIHSLVSDLPTFSAFEDIRRWAAAAGGEVPDCYPELQKTADSIEQILLEAGLPLVFCHNDAQYLNFILGFRGEVRVVDWDYAGPGWACYDLGQFSSYLNPATRAAFLAEYDPMHDEAQEARVELMQFVAALREVVWACQARLALEGTTTLADGWSYQGHIDYNLNVCQSCPESGSVSDLLERARDPRGRKDW